ncbi:hypothetical protein Zmor_024892 [Zophobas morio]|uniref:Uncharacterized protein n=1 Tax=Zophobas morio TaxID=2755281 RepID=A0AA38HVS2_9CUCU|nr:hypothetical protein Zmor_024892 [Zophobas morio]
MFALQHNHSLNHVKTCLVVWRKLKNMVAVLKRTKLNFHPHLSFNSLEISPGNLLAWRLAVCKRYLNGNHHLAGELCGGDESSSRGALTALLDKGRVCAHLKVLTAVYLRDFGLIKSGDWSHRFDSESKRFASLKHGKA